MSFSDYYSSASGYLGSNIGAGQLTVYPLGTANAKQSPIDDALSRLSCQISDTAALVHTLDSRLQRVQTQSPKNAALGNGPETPPFTQLSAQIDREASRVASIRAMLDTIISALEL